MEPGGNAFFVSQRRDPLHRSTVNLLLAKYRIRSQKKPDGYILEDFADSARKMVEAARTRWSATLASTDANSGPHKRFIEQATHINALAAFLADERFDDSEAAKHIGRSAARRRAGAAYLRGCKFHQSLAGRGRWEPYRPRIRKSCT